MKISKVIKKLEKAKNDYGDVNVRLMDPKCGDWLNANAILKLHPYTGVFGCMNRNEPVNAIGIDSNSHHSKDLIL